MGLTRCASGRNSTSHPHMWIYYLAETLRHPRPGPDCVGTQWTPEPRYIFVRLLTVSVWPSLISNWLTTSLYQISTKVYTMMEATIDRALADDPKLELLESFFNWWLWGWHAAHLEEILHPIPICEYITWRKPYAIQGLDPIVWGHSGHLNQGIFSSDYWLSPCGLHS